MPLPRLPSPSPASPCSSSSALWPPLGAGRAGALLLGLLAILLFAGCGGYQVGPTMARQSGATSIQINTFLNHTMEPRLSDAVTQAIRKRIQQDGTYQLDTHNTGDIVVTGTIIEYERTGVSFDPGDVITPRDFLLTLRAKIVARERGTGRVLFDGVLFGRTTARLLNDLPNTERQALPLVAEDLARRAVSVLVDGTW